MLFHCDVKSTSTRAIFARADFGKYKATEQSVDVWKFNVRERGARSFFDEHEEEQIISNDRIRKAIERGRKARNTIEKFSCQSTAAEVSAANGWKLRCDWSETIDRKGGKQ